MRTVCASCPELAAPSGLLLSMRLLNETHRLLLRGVLVETTGKKRDRVYAYQAYLDRLRAGTELSDRD